MKKDQLHDIDFKLKIPILNNMALSFIVKAGEFSHDLESVNENSKSKIVKMFRNQGSSDACVSLHDCYMKRSKNLIQQVLKIDKRNEKALMRKCNVLLALGEKADVIKEVLDPL